MALILIRPPVVFADPPEDDCSFIRQKIVALAEGGGEVVIPGGTYVCRSPIVLDRSYISLRGEGEVVLRLGNNVNAPVIVMGDAMTPPRPLREISVMNLRIDGNRWHQKFECWGGPCDGGGTSFIRNNGITVRGVTDGRIQDVYITGARSGGVVTERGCFDLMVDNLTAVDNEFDGFAGYETFGSRLTRLNLSHNQAAGISLDIRFHGNHFRDVNLDHNGDVGIFMRDSNANIFENVDIAESGNHGIFLSQADDPGSCSLGNEFQDLSVSRSRGFGFLLNDLCAGNRLTGVANFRENRDGCIGGVPGARLENEGRILCRD